MNMKLIILFTTLSLFAIEPIESWSGQEVVKGFFDYFRQETPLGIPLYEAGEPDKLPFDLELVSIVVNRPNVYGVSSLHIRTAYVDFVSLEGYISTSLSDFTFEGDYYWYDPLQSSYGTLKCNISQPSFYVNTSLEMIGDVMQIKDFRSIFKKKDVELELDGLSWMHRALYSSGGVHYFFDDILGILVKRYLPYYIKIANGAIKYAVNELPYVSPLYGYQDQFQNQSQDCKSLVKLARRILAYTEIDPMSIPDVKTNILGFHVKLSNIKIEGAVNIGDIQKLQIMYMDRHFYVFGSLYYPEAKISFNQNIQTLFMKEMDADMSLTVHNISVNAAIVIHPQLELSIVSSDLNIDIGWIGDINRYKKASPQNRFLAVIEKSLQDSIIKYLIRTIKPEISYILENANIENVLTKFFEYKSSHS